jgi:hypothetical protein
MKRLYIALVPLDKADASHYACCAALLAAASCGSCWQIRACHRLSPPGLCLWPSVDDQMPPASLIDQKRFAAVSSQVFVGHTMSINSHQRQFSKRQCQTQTLSFLLQILLGCSQFWPVFLCSFRFVSLRLNLLPPLVGAQLWYLVVSLVLFVLIHALRLFSPCVPLLPFCTLLLLCFNDFLYLWFPCSCVPLALHLPCTSERERARYK